MKTIADEDFQLLRRFVEAGSQEAFSQLVERHIDLVYAVCLRETGDSTLAQDVTQAVFLILFRKAPTIRRGTVLAGWLFKTARFASRNARRQEHRRKEMEQQLFEATLPGGEHFETWRSIEPLLHEGIASLGARDRDAILLRYFEDKSLREVGLALGTSEAAAQMRVSRAIEKLKKYLQKRGVAVPVAILGAVLLENAVQAAPASCAQAVGQTAIFSGSATAKAHLISQEVLKNMAITKLKAASLIAALGIVGAACVSHLASREAVSAAQVIPTPNPSWPSGLATLQKSKAAYLALSTYEGETSVHTQANLRDRMVESELMASIQFRRPNLLHINRLKDGRTTYKLTYDGGVTNFEFNLTSKPVRRFYASLEEALAPAANAPGTKHIPAALMGFDQNSPFRNMEAQNPKLEGQEDIGGAQCHRVSITFQLNEAPQHNSKRTFWVDAKSFLLRRYSTKDALFSSVYAFTIESAS